MEVFLGIVGATQGGLAWHWRVSANMDLLILHSLELIVVYLILSVQLFLENLILADKIFFQSIDLFIQTLRHIFHLIS